MAIETGLLINTTPGQTGTIRDLDRTMITKTKITASQPSANVTDLIIQLSIKCCNIVTIDPLIPGTVSSDQVFMKFESGALFLVDDNVASFYTTLSTTPGDLSLIGINLEVRSGGGKIGGPGLARAKKTKPKKRKK